MATYVGAIEHLRGERAMLQSHKDCERILAQFNNIQLTKSGRPSLILQENLGYGWHEFPVSDFKHDPDWEDPRD